MKKTINLILLFFMGFFLIGCTEFEETPRACTLDAKICPDGSSVGRVGPNCEFEKCPQENSLQRQCISFDGRWLEEYSECEYVSEDACSNMGGEFFECSSACRNKPEDTICTKQCVPICSFN